MNVFDIAQSVNNRLNDGDEGKFPITLIIVSEYSYTVKPINYFGFFTYALSDGVNDDHIMDMIRHLDAECDGTDDLGAMIRVQNATVPVNQYLRRRKSRLVKILGSSILLGFVAGYMILS